MKIDEKKRRGHGPEPMALGKKREHTVSVRLNKAELVELDGLRIMVVMQRGKYLRAASLHRLPRAIPAINREAWSALARVAGNLNQYQTAINEGRATGHSVEVIEELRKLVKQLRRDLLGLGQEGGVVCGL